MNILKKYTDIVQFFSYVSLCSTSSIKTLVCQNVCKCQLVHFDPEKPNLDFLWCKYSVEYILYKADFNS